MYIFFNRIFLKYLINLIDPRIFGIPKALGTCHFDKGKGDLKIK